MVLVERQTTACAGEEGGALNLGTSQSKKILSEKTSPLLVNPPISTKVILLFCKSECRRSC